MRRPASGAPALSARGRADPAFRQRGIALLGVLWVGVVLGALAGAAASLGRTDVDLAHNHRVRAEAELAAASAARLAVYALANGVESEIAADGGVTAWRLGEAEVRVEVTPERVRLDVNRASVPELAEALTEAGAEGAQAERLAAAIVDFVDQDDFLTPEGAERPDYRAAGVAGPKNAPLEHEDELLGVIGMPPALYRRLAEHLTVQAVRAGATGLIEEPPPEAASGAGVDEPLPPAFALALDTSPRLIREGTEMTRARIYRIRAEAVTASGARAVRIAIAGIRGRAELRAWRSGRPILFPEAVAAAEPAAGQR